MSNEIIESYYNYLRTYVDIQLLDLLFAPIDKIYIDFSIVSNEIIGNNFIIEILGYDTKDKLQYSDGIENYNLDLGVYKSITITVVYFLLQIINYI